MRKQTDVQKGPRRGWPWRTGNRAVMEGSAFHAPGRRVYLPAAPPAGWGVLGARVRKAKCAVQGPRSLRAAIPETRKAPASEPSTVRPHTRRAHVLIQAVFRETLDQAAKNPAPSPLGGGFH